MRRGYLTPPVMIILALITLGVALTLFLNTNLLKNIKKQPAPTPTPAINSFEDCAKADNRILLTYPRQCKTPDGKSFTEIINQESLDIAPCDINSDGKCNTEDLEWLNEALGTSRGQKNYHPLADLDADGVINATDKQILLKLLDENQSGETANWKTYKGKYFSFKYPASWTEETGPASSYPENLEAIGLRIGIAVFEADYKNYSYEEKLQNFKGNNPQKIKELKVAGREATKFEYIGQGDVLPSDYSVISVLVKGSNDKSFLIGFNGPRKDITDELIDQILSTFRFID